MATPSRLGPATTQGVQEVPVPKARGSRTPSAPYRGSPVLVRSLRGGGGAEGTAGQCTQTPYPLHQGRPPHPPTRRVPCCGRWIHRRGGSSGTYRVFRSLRVGGGAPAGGGETMPTLGQLVKRNAPALARAGDGLHADGGLLSPNPTPHGLTWAWRLVADGRVAAEDGGVITCAGLGMETTENNLAETLAMLFGLEALPDGWSGTVHTDNRNALMRALGRSTRM